MRQSIPQASISVCLTLPLTTYKEQRIDEMIELASILAYLNSFYNQLCLKNYHKSLSQGEYSAD